jgi:hypothetical protein
MAVVESDPTRAATLPERMPPPASAAQAADVRSDDPARPLPAGVRIIDGEQLYSAAWLGGGNS